MRFTSQAITLMVFLMSQQQEQLVVVEASVVSECNTRLPMSLSTVISDLEAEGIQQVAPACFLTSRGVTQEKKAELFGLEDPSTTSFGTDSGVCMALSTSPSIPEAASTAVACSGNIVYHPDDDDLARGEGLFDTLGPAMERMLNEDSTNIDSPTSLIVVTKNPKTTKIQLEDAAADIIANLVSTKKKVAVLGDIFDTIEYVESTEEAMQLLTNSKDPSEAQESIASTVASDFWQGTPMTFISSTSAMSPKDLAAARQLGPAARKALETAVDTVKAMSQDGQEIVGNFNDLCVAATKRAMEELQAAAASPSLSSSAIGKQIQSNLKEELEGELADLASIQLDLLQEACFVEFRGKLSKLRITPNLSMDMQNVVKESVGEFSKRAKKMPISSSDAKVTYQNRLQEFCSERLLAARASGQFRPLPRKGVNIGLHWLLPKPFGNDYRQEPWMVQATDNLVYVPPDKITDVNPDDVTSGDWRSKIVPSPSGNEMIYMQ